MGRIGVVHGPNLNLLGQREPERYGSTTLDEINAQLAAVAHTLGHSIEAFQSNHEGALIDFIQQAPGRHDALLLNAAGYTHTSVALRDAVLAVRPLVVIEVHLTIPATREAFRRTNLIEDVVSGRIEGFGAPGYVLALRAASALIAPRGEEF